MNEYLSFKKFITPSLIQVIFWVGFVVIVLASLVMMAGAVASPYGGGGMFLIGLLYLVLGSLFWRVWCELMLLFFQIYDELRLIRSSKIPDPAADR